MCGIATVLQNQKDETNSSMAWMEELVTLLHRRGPDDFNTTSVLHIQGDKMTSQPLTDPNGNIFCWNGEVFGGIDLCSHSSDTIQVFHMLNLATTEPDVDFAIVNQLCRIWGPYAFIYFNSINHTLYYGRDPFGRRSLLHYIDRGGCVKVISSVTVNINVKEDITLNSSQNDDDDQDNVNNDSNHQSLSTITTTVVEDDIESTWIEDRTVPYGWSEVNIQGIWKINISDENLSPLLIPWPNIRLKLSRLPNNTNTTTTCYSDTSLSRIKLATKFLQVLSSSMERRLDRLFDRLLIPDTTKSIDRILQVGILFSGGIDSVLLAAILAKCLSEHSFVDKDDDKEGGESNTSHQIHVNLLNISFFNQTIDVKTNDDDCDDNTSGNNLIQVGVDDPSPDRLAAISAVSELTTLFPRIKWNLVHIDISSDERKRYESHVKSIIYPSNTHMDLNIGTAFWFATRGIGYLRSYTTQEQNEIFQTTYKGTSRPLLRVGEHGAASATGQKQTYHHISSSSSRLNGKRKDNPKIPCSLVTEGCRLYSKEGCLWNLCKKCCIHNQRKMINQLNSRDGDDDGDDDSDDHRHHYEKSDSHPSIQFCQVHKLRGHDENNQLSESKESLRSSLSTLFEISEIKVTEDDNLNDHSKESRNLSIMLYKSKCRAYLIGLGADEQLAGYGRHRTIFLKGGIEALEEELNMDMNRLWRRNLGRDDRCVSDNGVEGWFPFLDEEVVDFIQRLSIHQICDLSEGQGVGDKRILRDTAALLGLSSNCHQLVKRAIQFGTRIAKQTNNCYHGSNRKGKGNTLL